MKKNFFFGLFALATMLFTASCSEQELVDPSLLNGDAVTFNVTTEIVGTRAAATGEGSLATQLYYGVYEFVDVDKDGDLEWSLVSAISKTTEPVALPKEGTVVNIRLAKQKKYSVIFWAQSEAANALCKVDWTNRKLDVQNATANQESYDAFWGYDEVTLTGALKREKILVRPFAQLNIGVSDEDYQAAINASVELNNSAVTVKKVPTTMSLVDGTVGEPTNTVVYASAPIPTSTDWTFPVSGNKYLALNYVLVGTDQKLIDVELSYTDKENGSYSSTFTDVPVRRNYRTNIYGNLLTSDADYSVKIDAGIDGDVNEEENVALQLAAQAGGNFTLTEDLTLTSPLAVTADFVLNLNGKTISGEFSDKTVIKNTGKLTLIGGTVKNTATNGAAVITNSGQLVLKGVAINGAPIGTEGYPAYAVMTSGGELTVEEGTTISSDRGAVHMSNGANVTINGGNFEVTDAVGSRTLTSHVIYASGSSSKLTINGGNFAQNIANGGGTSVICPAGATIKVYGGNFYHVPVSDVQSGCFQNYMGSSAPVDVYGGTYNDESVTKSGNLAEGYVASANDDGTYTVVPGVKLDNNADFETAINNAAPGSTIVLPDNITQKVTIGELKDVTIEGSGNTSMRFVTNAYSKIENVTIKNIDFEFTTGAGQKNGACVVIDAAAQIDNLVIENVAFVGDGKKNSYGIFGQNSNASIVIKNCSFSNIGYAIQATAGGGYQSLTVETCTFDNIISWAILPQYGYNGDLTINGCTFNNSNGGLVKTGAINGTFTFTNNTITNCTGHDGKDSKWFEVDASGATKVIDGNTKDGVAWTPGEANGLK